MIQKNNARIPPPRPPPPRQGAEIVPLQQISAQLHQSREEFIRMAELLRAQLDARRPPSVSSSDFSDGVRIKKKMNN